MNIKSISSLALVAIAMVAASVAPAQANNNSRYMNDLARQYYWQNQAAAGNAALTNSALAAANNAALTNQAVAAANNAALTNQAVAAANNAALTNQALTAATLQGSVMTPAFTSVTPALTAIAPTYGTVGVLPYSNGAYATNGAVATEINLLNQQIVKLQAQLAMSTNPVQASKLENKIAMIQTEENNLATTGSPYGLNGGLITNLTGYLRRF